MNIAVEAEGLKFTAQIRAYVEYRMFSAISRFGGRCVSLSVSLEETESAQLGTQYRCAAILYLTPSGRVRVSAASDRPYAAVDQSAERLSRAVARRLKQGSFGPGSRPGRPSSRGLTSRGRSRKKNSS
jgi:ribosomal subunit interface protein